MSIRTYTYIIVVGNYSFVVYVYHIDFSDNVMRRLDNGHSLCTFNNSQLLTNIV